MLILLCTLKKVECDSIKKNSLYTEKSHIACIIAYEVVCTDNKFSKKFVLYREKMLFTNLLKPFLVSIVMESDRGVIKKHFNKNLIMSAEEERFQLSNFCWICDKLFDIEDDKVRDHYLITGKYRGASHWSCNINLKMSKKIPVIFHNLKGFDSHLIIKELSKFDIPKWKSVTANGLEK